MTCAVIVSTSANSGIFGLQAWKFAAPLLCNSSIVVSRRLATLSRRLLILGHIGRFIMDMEFWGLAASPAIARFEGFQEAQIDTSDKLLSSSSWVEASRISFH